jgi:radical SAM superfamily enzyme YgiQ (UPF0313 family)
MNNPLYRPPAEANSLILQIDKGCPYNACTFCGMYKGTRYQQRTLKEIDLILQREVSRPETIRRIFLADGDVMSRSYDELVSILELIKKSISNVTRINTYATGTSILDKQPEELKDLKKRKLHTLYMGLESGDENTLKHVRKGETAEAMVKAAGLAQTAGLRMSIIVLLGLGGADRSFEHAIHTAEVLNKMQPRLLSFLRVVPVPGTIFAEQIANKELELLSEYAVIKELKWIVERLDLRHTVFRANHSSNIVPLEARFSKDKVPLLKQLELLLNSDDFDKISPGPLPMVPAL